MSFDSTRGFSGPLGQQSGNPLGGSWGVSTTPQPPRPVQAYDSGSRGPETEYQGSAMFHGEALARDLWLERYAGWIMAIFTGVFALFLIVMALAKQIPGQSFLLKGISDFLQFAGEGVGFVFCLRIAIRLRRVSLHFRQVMMQQGTRLRQRTELVGQRTEAQAAQRAFLAWAFLTLAIALYASGQAIWTSYDVRMASSAVPFPGIYDIGFVGSYPFFLLGTLLLTRRNRATVGRTRLILDAMAVIGASLALSWFFVLSPSIAGLSQAPSPGAAFLSIYFPAGDLFLVAIGAFLMFSPLANREQQPVFLRLCLGLFFLAITDSLLGYFSLSPSGFNTGTLQDILWPLSMLLIGLAAVEYPRSIAREQEQEASTNTSGSLLTTRRASQISSTLQTISPFVLALLTCALLLVVIAPRGGAILVQAGVIAFVLFLIVAARQALTLIENNRLTMQIRGDLVVSNRELLVTRRQADEASREAQEKRALQEGVSILQQIHARVAHGDFTARVPIASGPLFPIATSFNLMLDRLRDVAQRGARYEHLVSESKLLQEALDRLEQGLPAWSAGQALPAVSVELRPVFLSLAHLQRSQENQWHRMTNAVESTLTLTRRLREVLNEVGQSKLLADISQSTSEKMLLERAIRAGEQMEQQQRSMLSQLPHSNTHIEESPRPASPTVRGEPSLYMPNQQAQMKAWQRRWKSGESNVSR